MGGTADALGGFGEGIGALIGYWGSAGNRKKAEEDYENALKGYQNLNASQQGATNFDQAQLQMDPQGRNAQLAALGQLEDTYRSQGLDAGTRAQLNQAQQSNAMQSNAQQQAIQNRMQQQGLASSGANFSGQRQAAQGAAMANMAAGQGAAQLGSQRQMQALSGAAGIGANVQQQDWNQLAQRAAAQDAITHFNTANSNNMKQFRAAGMDHAYGNMAANQTGQGQQLMGVDAGVGRGIGQAAGAGADFFKDFLKGG